MCRVVAAGSQLADSHVSDLTRASSEYLEGAKTNEKWMRVLTAIIALSSLGYFATYFFRYYTEPQKEVIVRVVGYPASSAASSEAQPSKPVSRLRDAR